MYQISLDDFCNEPAFPEAVAAFPWATGGEHEVFHSRNTGLTRLEYFTAQAMNKPDPLMVAKTICLELWNVRRKGFADSTEIIS